MILEIWPERTIKCHGLDPNRPKLILTACREVIWGRSGLKVPCKIKASGQNTKVKDHGPDPENVNSNLVAGCKTGLGQVRS